MTMIDEFTDSAAWWREVHDDTDTPIIDLVDGFDAIDSQAIPYGWLPRRAHTAYAADYTTWSQLADETIDTLLDRPKAGISTVRAIVLAARDAVAHARSTPADEPVDAATAVDVLLDRLSDYDYQLLAARVWALTPQTIAMTAGQIGAARINVQRTTPRARRRFQDLLADPAHARVLDHAAQLRQRLGPMTREDTAALALRDVGLDLATDAGQLLLYVAGPYSRRDDWLEDTSTNAVHRATELLDAAVARIGAPTISMLIQELATLAIPTDTAVDFIRHHPGLRCFGDRWVHWGDTMASKTEAALHLSAAPATPAHLAATIGDDCREQSVREALWEDDRFIRATKQSWALRRWGIDEYTGVFSEIGARIDAAGGAISISDLIADMRAAFPDVAETSVRTYVGAPGFVTDRGMVRRRTPADGWPAVPPAHAIRGTFHNGRNEIRVALRVTSDLLRGSGQVVNPAVATALGIHPGQRRTFIGKRADVTLFWRLSATSGANFGSLRPLATALSAELNDTLVLALNVRHATVTAARIGADETAAERLRTLLGKPVRDPAVDLARGLRCRPDEVGAQLRRRGDDELADLIDEVPSA